MTDKDAPVSQGDPVADAAAALVVLHSDPEKAEALARTAVRSARPGGDYRAVSIAERVLGVVARQRHDLPRSAKHLQTAVRVAELAGLHECAAEARMTLVATLALQGDSAGALREAEQAGRVLRGATRGRLETQLARLHLHQGDLEEALEGFRRALRVLRRVEDRLGEAHALAGRGVAYYLRGSVSAAEADMRRAEGLYLDLGDTRMAASTLQHLALVHALRGDVPEALASFDRADQFLGGTGVDGMALIDRSEVELSARLMTEARASAQTAVDALARQGEAAYLAFAQVRLAQAALMNGDLQTARAVAEEARTAFVRQRRRPWAALARHLAVRAAWSAGERSPTLLQTARAAATELSTAGFAAPSQDARLLAAQVALDLGRQDVARRELTLASRARRGPVELRVRSWHAHALVRLAEGNRRGAESAILAGTRLLERYRLTLGATELRAHASGHLVELANLGVAVALADGDAERVVTWVERWRAGSLRLRPVRPPDDARLAAALTELRAVVGEVEAAALAGRPTIRLQARQAALEEAVRTKARHATGVLAASLAPSPTADKLKRSARDHALVEIVEHDAVLHAAVVMQGCATLYRLAPVADVTIALERLQFALRRLAFGRGSAASLAAAGDAVALGAKELDAMLLAPLVADIGKRPLVVIPPGRLHVTPWSLLPSCVGRPVAVAPSAALWLRAREGAEEDDHAAPTVLVAGPALTQSGPEISALARRYPEAVRLGGSKATCAAVSAAIDGARLAHVAAHGQFRADNPLFSALRMSDGPLTVYDLEGLKQAPRLLVLSACESGLSDVRPGDELMGLAAAMFSLGTRAVIASVCQVPDDATRRLMLALHRGLRTGLRPATALARAQARIATTGPAGLAAAAGFVCFGAG